MIDGPRSRPLAHRRRRIRHHCVRPRCGRRTASVDRLVLSAFGRSACRASRDERDRAWAARRLGYGAIQGTVRDGRRSDRHRHLRRCRGSHRRRLANLATSRGACSSRLTTSQSVTPARMRRYVRRCREKRSGILVARSVSSTCTWRAPFGRGGARSRPSGSVVGRSGVAFVHLARGDVLACKDANRNVSDQLVGVLLCRPFDGVASRWIAVTSIIEVNHT
jgi:hypothetical protein